METEPIENIAAASAKETSRAPRRGFDEMKILTVIAFLARYAGLKTVLSAGRALDRHRRGRPGDEARLSRAHHVGVDLGSDGALQQTDRDHDPVSIWQRQQNAFHPGEWPLANHDSLANAEKRPGHRGKAGSGHHLNRGYFFFGNGSRRSAVADDAENTGGGQNRQT